MSHIQVEVEKARIVKKNKIKINENLENEKVDKTISAFQELYELTQRKLLYRIAHIAAKMDIGIFPRLVYIDLIEKEKLETSFNFISSERFSNSDPVRKGSKHRQDSIIDNEEIELTDGSRYQFSIDQSDSESAFNMGFNAKRTPYVLCLRVMCAYEQGWHQVETYSVLNDLKNEYCPYLSRMMNLLRK
jgi:hypothetical protein